MKLISLDEAVEAEQTVRSFLTSASRADFVPRYSSSTVPTFANRINLSRFSSSSAPMSFGSRIQSSVSQTFADRPTTNQSTAHQTSSSQSTAHPSTSTGSSNTRVDMSSTRSATSTLFGFRVPTPASSWTWERRSARPLKSNLDAINESNEDLNLQERLRDFDEFEISSTFSSQPDSVIEAPQIYPTLRRSERVTKGKPPSRYGYY